MNDSRKSERSDMSSWENSIVLDLDEKIVMSWRGNWEIVGEVLREKLFSGRIVKGIAKDVKRGFLVLTNKRLLFIEEHGIFGKSYDTALMLPLLDIGEVSMGGTVMPYVSIVHDDETYVFHLSGIGKSQFESFRESVMYQCERRKWGKS
jgi:hypothetical protein